MTSVLLTVPDQGAAEAVCEALGEAGIEATLRRSWRRHAYQPSPFATPFDVLVAPSSLEAARDVVRRLGHENVEEADAAPEARPRRRLSYAVALVVALVPMFPLASFYAGARRWGTLFVGITLTAFFLMFARGETFSVNFVASPYPAAWHGWLRPRDTREDEGNQRPSQRPFEQPLTPGERANLTIGRTLTLAKLGDLAVALWLVRRQRAARR